VGRIRKFGAGAGLILAAAVMGLTIGAVLGLALIFAWRAMTG
jgi:hypothetical protein